MSLREIFRLIRSGDRRAWLYLARWLLLMYTVWCLLLWLLQERLLFPRQALPAASAGPKDPRIQVWRRAVPGGDVECWYVPNPDASADKPTPAVVYFHGNGMLIDHQGEAVDLYRRLGYAVLLPEYRGYGRSRGKPTQKAIVADAVDFVDRLRAMPEVDRARIIYHGRSVGGGPAAALAAARPPAALVLESTFTSVAHMARRYLAPPFLIRNPFRTIDVVREAGYPLLILHGTLDKVVPVAEGRLLHAAAPGAAYVEFTAGHNDLPHEDEQEKYETTFRAFLARANSPSG